VVAPAPQNTTKTQAKERPEKLLLLVLFLCVFAGGTINGTPDPAWAADLREGARPKNDYKFFVKSEGLLLKNRRRGTF